MWQGRSARPARDAPTAITHQTLTLATSWVLKRNKLDRVEEDDPMPDLITKQTDHAVIRGELA
jgi:hypothetical protein